MYCRNCGYNMDPQAAICVKCGVPAGNGNNFCSHCSQPTEREAAFCTHCGVSLAGRQYAGQTNSDTLYEITGRKSKLAAGLLGIFLGGLGIHNFYLGFTSRGVAQLLISVLSCGVLSPVSAIWGLVEGILVLTGERGVDADGQPLRD